MIAFIYTYIYTFSEVIRSIVSILKHFILSIICLCAHKFKIPHTLAMIVLFCCSFEADVAPETSA